MSNKIITFYRSAFAKESYETRLVRRIDDAESIAGFLQSSSGYVREAAARRAKELLVPELLAPLIVRVNDWVPQVRQAAMAAVMAY